MRPSWIEIDLDAVEHNVRQIGAEIGEADVCAVVKADAYGHGDIPVAEAAIRGGAGWLAVALVEEGVRLREAGAPPCRGSPDRHPRAHADRIQNRFRRATRSGCAERVDAAVSRTPQAGYGNAQGGRAAG